MDKAVSNVKLIPYSPNRVYARLADLRNVEQVKERAKAHPEMAQQLAEQGVSFNIEDLVCEEDRLRLPVPGMGEVGLVIAEREENRMLKLEVTDIPLTAKLWIQLLPDGENEEQTRMKLTLGYDIPFILRTMLKGKLSRLQNGVDKIADLLAGLNYE
jgi:hypothetical protein